MEIIQEFGKIAGIAGLGLGVFLFLFKDLIAKNIFPNMTQEQGYKIIRLFMFLVWSIAIVGIFSWLFLEHKNKIEQTQTTPAEVKKETVKQPENTELPQKDETPPKVASPRNKAKTPIKPEPEQTQTNTMTIGENNGNAQQNNNKGDVHSTFPAITPVKKEKND